MKVSDIPQSFLFEIRKRFEAEPRVHQLRVHQQMMERTGRYSEALQLGQKIDMLFNEAVYEYIREAEQQSEQIDASSLPMPSEDKEGLMLHLLMCFMCADIIETSVKDMDDILHRYDKTMHIEMFNDIRAVMKMSREKLKYLQENSGYMKDLVWADKCDDMYEMMKSKAGAIMRKRKHDPNYGKNTERLNK